VAALLALLQRYQYDAKLVAQAAGVLYSLAVEQSLVPRLVETGCVQVRVRAGAVHSMSHVAFPGSPWLTWCKRRIAAGHGARR